MQMRKETAMKEGKNPRKPLIYYYSIVLLVILLLNIFVFPALLSGRVQEVSYDQFLRLINEGKVTAAALDETRTAILFSFTDDLGKMIAGETGVWPDMEALTQLLLEKGVVFGAEIPTQSSPLLSSLLSFILPMLFFVLLGQMLMRGMQKRMGGNALTLGKNNAKIYIESETGKTFDDVAGQDEAKEALREIVDFLHNPHKYALIGAKLPKGALLVGPPGTGKTLLAKAVAGEAKVPFFSISGSEFVEMFVGMGAAKVRDLFKQAAEKAPCIVFIDEIDTIGKRRDSALPTGNDEREQTLNQLLKEMDGFDAAGGVVILAATNRPEILDPALLRPGRFDRRIPVELPDLKGRISILQVHSRTVKTEKDVDLAAIARMTPGASGAELSNIINESALRAVRMGRHAVSQQDLTESVETVIAGMQRKNAVISDDEKRLIAYHEIGHALVAASMKNSAPVTKITIIPRTSGALGYTMQLDDEEQVLLTRERAMRTLCTLTGGRAAEEIAFNTITSGAANDIEKITRLARAMVTRYGMSKHFGMVALETERSRYLGGDTAPQCSADTQRLIDEEVLEIIRTAHEKAKSILTEREKDLHRLSSYLLEKETVTGDEFMALLQQE